MNSSAWLGIAVLFVAFVAIKIFPRLLLRFVGRGMLTAVGKDALANVPDQVRLTRVTAPQWKDEAVIQKQAASLARVGFTDLGTYTVDKMPGVLVRMLFQSQTYVAAHLTEHPKAGNWIEFATRYSDGSSDFLTTLPDQGVAAPPFVRNTRADKATPVDRLYQQHLTKRKSTGIKAVTANQAGHEFELAYSRYMVWKTDKGLSPEEVAQMMMNRSKTKGQSAGR